MAGCAVAEVTGDDARRNFAHRDLSRFSTKLAENRGARSSCNPLSDRARFRSGGQRFYVCFPVGAARCRARPGMWQPGEKHKAKQRKTSVPDVESRLVRKSSTKDCGLRPTGSTGTHHKASTEAFFTPDDVVTDDGCTGSHSPNNNEKEYKGERLNAHKAHHRIRRRKTVQDDVVFKQVGAFCRRERPMIRVRIVVVVSPSAGGLTPSGEFATRKTIERQTSFRTDCTSTDRGSNSLQDAVVFVVLSAFLRRERPVFLPASGDSVTVLSRGALLSRNSQSASASTVANGGTIRTPLERA